MHHSNCTAAPAGASASQFVEKPKTWKWKKSAMKAKTGPGAEDQPGERGCDAAAQGANLDSSLGRRRRRAHATPDIDTPPRPQPTCSLVGGQREEGEVLVGGLRV